MNGRFRWAVALGAAMVMAGCAGLGDFVAKPTVEIDAVRFADLSLSQITLEFDVGVTNPYSVPLPVTQAAFRLASRGTTFLSGASEEQGSIPAGGREVYPVRATVPFAALLSALSGVKPGAVVPFEAKLDLSVDTPVLGKITLPLSKSGDLPVPAVPDVSLPKIRLDNASLSDVAATLSIGLGNTNSFPLDLASGRFRVTLAGVEVGGADLARAVSLAAGQSGTVDLPIRFSPLSAGVAVFKALTGSGIGYRLEGELAGNTRWGPITLPFASGGDAAISR